MKHNLFENREPPPTGERFETLASFRNVRVERIISSARPEHTRYVQVQDEWVVLLSGEAVVDIDGEINELVAGDCLLLSAGVPHGVLRTSSGALWLAVHVHAEPGDGGPRS